MNLRQTAEVSAIIATSAAHIIENPRSVPTESLHGYWKQSRTRLKCWFAGLRAGRTTPQGGLTTRPQQTQLISLSREILVTEMLTRVWSTVLTAKDRHQGTNHAAATASNSYQGHLEARHEVLRLIADDHTLPAEDQASLDRFRRRIERWTDALLGPLLAAYGVEEFVFDEARAHDFAGNSLQQTLSGVTQAYVPLLVAGVTAAFPRESDADRERAGLNLAIVRSILAAFPKGAFPSGGQVTSAIPREGEWGSRQPEPPAHSFPDSQNAQRRSPGKGLNFIEIRSRNLRDRSSPD